jgi:hypothetical protein
MTEQRKQDILENHTGTEQKEIGRQLNIWRPGLALKNPPKKTHPKKPKKTHLKKPTKNGFFWVFFGFF